MKLKDSPTNDLTRLHRDIKHHVVCTKCEREYLTTTHDAKSLADYVDIEAGFTSLGVQLWCRRHDCNVLHIDFAEQDTLVEFRCFEPKNH
jgi:metal-dependent HD superfamily phosphatase/phosphodiesterase